ncbi:MAG: hypothetical protein AB1757_03960 [Acidobacteriota bacterium]
MAANLLDELIKQSEKLSPDEQLKLIAHLADRARRSYPSSKPRRQWKEICGVAPYPLVGEDAQDWVSRSRRESDENR